MTTRNLKDQAVIAGIGQTEFSKESGRSEIQLCVEASLSAIKDAGMTPADIDGLVTYTLDSSDEIAVIQNLGISEARYFSRVPFGGGATCGTIQHAAAAVATGAAKNVLIYRAFNERSGHRFGQPMNAGGMQARGFNFDPEALPPMALGFMYGLSTPASIYSLHLARYMHKYGVKNEDLGRYSVIARKHAATNPNAWFYGRPITLEDHQNSRWIVEPILRLLDCCQESDGGVAFVVTAAERAKDLPRPAARIVAASSGATVDTSYIQSYYHDDLSTYPAFEVVARALWEGSGLGPDDMDAAMLYDHFTPIVLMQLEELGFCGRGEAKHFIADGHIEMDGKLPVNTHGGLLGEAYIHGLNHITEAVRQLRGTAANQLAKVDHIVITAGMSGLLLGRTS